MAAAACWPHTQWQPHTAAETQGGVSDGPARLRAGPLGTQDTGSRALEPEQHGWGRLVGWEGNSVGHRVDDGE